MPLTDQQKQRVADIRNGVANAPASIVNNERAHLLEVFAAFDTEKADLMNEVTALKAENLKLQQQIAVDTDLDK